ncbi:MAG: hypothetical protein A3F10_02545 [Coxiella sp. RIFCSPHIGHO2_12_FULL_42_15]|nr:MAG: hypothetical protein A3F10_02545 [Coxiella sp. RIFCSPHIGHO2_12_FULL_42_15]
MFNLFNRKKWQPPPNLEKMPLDVPEESDEITTEEVGKWWKAAKERLETEKQADEEAKKKNPNAPPTPTRITIAGYSEPVRCPGGKFVQSELTIPGMNHATVTVQHYDSGHTVMNSTVPPQTKGDMLEKAIEKELERCVALLYKMYEPTKTFRLTSVGPARFAGKVRDVLLSEGFEYVWHDGDRWKMENGKVIKAPPENDLDDGKAVASSMGGPSPL